MRVVCDAGPLIALAKLGHVNLLAKLYQKVIIPRQVYEEVVVSGSIRGYSNTQAIKILIDQGYIEIHKAARKETYPALGSGETEAINLAIQEKATIILLDDLQARKEARKKKLKIKGTIGVLLEAYTKGFLTKEDTKFLLEAIKSDDDIWIANEIIDEALKKI